MFYAQAQILARQAWNSPTLMSWVSYSTKALTFFAVLPMVLAELDSADIVLWYLFSSIILIQGAIDLGFRQTFSRIISFAYVGLDDFSIIKSSSKPENSASSAEVALERKGPMHRVVSNMRRIYAGLTILVLLLMGTLGTFSVIQPIAKSPNILGAWSAWALVVLCSSGAFFGRIYSIFLEGVSEIALVRRVEILTSLGTIVSSLIVLWLAPSLILLVLVSQIWSLAVVFRDRLLCRRWKKGAYTAFDETMPFDRPLLQKTWPSIWRAGLSGAVSIVIINITGVLYAHMVDADRSAGYLMAQRLINQVRDISMAPFYSKLPSLSMLRAKGATKSLTELARRGMFISHASYVILFIIIGIFATELISQLKTSVQFVDPDMWALMGLAFFCQRFGAMHLQVYMTTNHVVSHIADGISGALSVALLIILYPIADIYAFPLSMVLAFSAFYCWYSAALSYKSISESPYAFEKKAALIPTAALVIYCAFTSLQFLFK